MKAINLYGQGLAILFFFLFMACDQLAPPPAGGTGKRVEPIIRSVRVRDYIDYGETSGTRSAGGEKRIVGQPIIQDLGGGMLAEITIGEDISALRADENEDGYKTLDNNVRFRVIAVDKSNDKIYSYADYKAEIEGETKSIKQVDGNLHVLDGKIYYYIFISYNNATLPTPAPNEGDAIGDIAVTAGSKDLLWGKIDTGSAANGVPPDLNFEPEHKLARVTLKLKGGSRTITDVDNSKISLNDTKSGSFNLKEGTFSSSTGNTVFTGWSQSQDEANTFKSEKITFIPQEKYTFSFAAEAISWEDNATTGKTTAGSIGSDKFTFKPGKNYTVTLRILRLPKFAGSNIYWDSANSRLTFDSYGTNNDHARYQGVYFKWGSLIGVAAGAQDETFSSGTTASSGQTDGTPIYMKNKNGNWVKTNVAYATQRKWFGSGSTVENKTDDEAWSPIPSYYNVDITFPVGDDAKTLLHANYENFDNYKGDICKYIDQNYRMPTRNELDSLKSYHKGYTAGEITVSKADGTCEVTTQYTTLAGIVLPASGYREFSYGSLFNVGSYGHYWSGSADSGPNDAYFLYFNSSGKATTGLANRSYGFPVRCVKN